MRATGGRFRLVAPVLLIYLFCLCLVDGRRRQGERDFPRHRGGEGAGGVSGPIISARADDEFEQRLRLAAIENGVTPSGGEATLTTTATTTTYTEPETTPTSSSSTTETEETTTKHGKHHGKGKKKDRKGHKNRKKHHKPDEAYQLMESAPNISSAENATESSSNDESRRVLVIDASFKAEDIGLNSSAIEECLLWSELFAAEHEEVEEEAAGNSTAEEVGDAEQRTRELEGRLQEVELISSKKRLKELGLDEALLDEWTGIELHFREVCAQRERHLWLRSAEEAKAAGIHEESPICTPFKEELTPNVKKLTEMAATLFEAIQTHDGNFHHEQKALPPNATAIPGVGIEERPVPGMEDEVVSIVSSVRDQTDDVITNKNFAEGSIVTEDDSAVTSSTRELTAAAEVDEEYYFVEEIDDNKVEHGKLHDHKAHEEERLVKVSTTTPSHSGSQSGTDIGKKQLSRDDPEYYYFDDTELQRKKFDASYEDSEWKRRRRRRRTNSEESSHRKEGATERDAEEEDSDWLDTLSEEPAAATAESNNTVIAFPPFFEINVEDETSPILYINTSEAARALGLSFPPKTFSNHQGLALFLPGVCAGFVPKTVDRFNESSFEGIQIEGPIGVNISALEAAGVNLTMLVEKLRNDTEVDEILSRTNESTRTLGGSFILPVLNKNQYDAYSAPVLFEGSAVVVRFGVYIESMSNFQTTTMDYDMDIYLLMAWRDARLVNPYDKPILVKEEEVLEKIWRPDPFFANAKEAEFHEVTFLNFLMRIFPDGLVLYETRIRLKTACSLILCKYPHDKQTCELLIKSFAYPLETVRFEWFTRKEHAIDKNPDVKLPELYIDRYEPTTCDRTRKSGSFACLRAVFRLKRDVGFHIAQTYIPTSLALMFSWVGVWLPEEFMEGRIGVAITVLLTLSTESAGAREHLPSVSYLKAIDLWFGFITGFVFFTLLQTLFVIGFDKRAAQLRKYALKKRSDLTEEIREAILRKADRYHKTGRYLDNFCRVFYPLTFTLFLIMYYFVYTEGRQDDCITRT